MNANHLLVVNTQENLGVVDSLLHPLALLIRQILTRSGRLELNRILIDDEENIIQALKAGVEIPSVFYSGEEMLSKDLMRNVPANVTIHEVARRTCKKLFENDKISRVFAIDRTPPLLDLKSLATVSQDIVALEDLTISGNIGAIIRTSLALGVGGIVLLNANPVDIYDRRIIRASRGHIFSLPVTTATTEELIRFCKDQHIPILVTAVQADMMVDEMALMSRRLLIAFGSEKEGCSQVLTDASTLQVMIPMNSKVESLNVSTAAGIMLYNRIWFNHSQNRK